MKALVVNPGTQHSFRLAVELHHLNALAGLHTGFAIASGGVVEAICNRLPAAWQRPLSNRRLGELPNSLVHLQPVLECLAVTRLQRGADAQAVMHWRNERFQKNASQGAIAAADVIIGFDTSSWILARRCRELGKPLVMVQTIGHPDSKKAVHEEIVARFPEWRDRNELRLPVVRQAEQEEHAGATLIVASSSFTRRTLVEHGVASSKIRILPHGVDCTRFSAGTRTEGRRFRFVFVGIIDARKGVPLLIEAWRRLKPPDAELWLVGPASAQARALLPKLPGLHYMGEVPQMEVPGILRECDVFAFPSYFEGFGLVLLQAMACGLPVITTEATAGPDLLSGSEAGWIVPVGDVEKLTGAMNHCLSHPKEVSQAGRVAREIAERFNWQVYGRRWLTVLKEAVEVAAGTRRLRISNATARVPARGATLSSAARLPKVLVAHPGTQYSAQLARQLGRLGVLGEFRTSLAFAEQGFVAGAVAKLPARWSKKLANRRISSVPASRLHTRPWQELMALVALRCGVDEQKVFFRRNAWFQRSVPDRAIRAADVLIGFDTSSWILARRVRDLGRTFILDQSIGHPRSLAKLAVHLNLQFADWPSTILPKFVDDFDREEQEHAAAGCIVVPSRFVARTLEENGVDAAKIRINPFGVDLERFQPALSPPPMKPLRFIFTGSLMRRKGVPLLLDAWSKLPRNHGAELLIVGSGELPAAVRRELPDSVRFMGRLPQAELSELIRQSHVFVFPSYFEGLAQVQIEAAASGLPVIGTENSGCAEIVREGETGFILPVGDMDELRAALMKFISSPELVLTMRERLLAERQKLSWDAYGDRWLKILREATANP